jgi:acyl dehydratase
MINLFEDRHVLAHLGQRIGSSRWIDVPQQRITDFGHITEDPDLMHIDPAWAAEHSPYGKTIAFGFLTVSLLTRMANDVIQRPADEVSTLNYGFDRLRLLSPVMVGSRIRGHFVLKELQLRSPTQFRANYAVTVEIDGQQKPALVADWLSVTNVRQERLPLAPASMEPPASMDPPVS